MFISSKASEEKVTVKRVVKKLTLIMRSLCFVLLVGGGVGAFQDTYSTKEASSLPPPPSGPRSLPSPPSDRLVSPRTPGGGLSPEERDKVERRFRQWRSMSREKKEDLLRRWEQWRNMPPQERELYRKRFEQWRRLPPEEQNRLRQQLNHPERLTPEEREEIRRRFLGY